MKLVKWLDKHLEEILLVALLFVMMIIMGIQILARYALGNSLSWSEEITRFCFIWTGFLSCILRRPVATGAFASGHPALAVAGFNQSLSVQLYISDNKTSSHARIDHPSRENRSPSTEE